MTKFRFIRQLLLCAVFMGVLGPSWGNSASKILPPRFAYVANSGDDTVSIHAIDAATGQLLARGYVVTGSGGGAKPSAVAVDPSNSFLYVINEGHHNIQAFNIDPSSGALALVNSVPAGNSPKSIAVHPNGKFVYVASPGSNSVSSFTMDPAIGLTATSQSVLSTGGYPNSIAVHPSGLFLYVASRGSNGKATGGTISAYRINQDTGLLKLVNTRPAGKYPNSIAVYPALNGAFVYVTNEDSASILSYSIDQQTGKLSDWRSYRLSSNPLNRFVTYPTSITLDRWGRNAYVAYSAKSSSTGSNSGIMAYQVSRSGSEFTLVGRAPAGDGAVSIAANDVFIYVANKDSSEISAYSRDVSSTLPSAALIPLEHYGTVRTRSNPSSIAIATGTGRSLQAKFAYAADATGRFIAGYRIASAGDILSSGQTAQGGELREPGSNYPASGEEPRSIELDQAGKFAYVSTNKSIVTYQITPNSGALQQASQVATTIGSQNENIPFALHPTGRFIYAATDNGSMLGISAFTVDVSGNLKVASTFPTSPMMPGNITIDPSGRFVYAKILDPSGTFQKIHAFRIINDVTGELLPLGTFGNGLPYPADVSIAMDPVGKFLYLVSIENITNSSPKASIWAYAIDPITGALKVIPGSPFPTDGFSPSRIAMDPNGRFLYVLDLGVTNNGPSPNGYISIFRVRPSSGELISTGQNPIATGRHPDSMAIDPTNRFVYVTNRFSNNISAYEIVKPDTGTLSLLNTVVFSNTGLSTPPTSIGIVGTYATLP